MFLSASETAALDARVAAVEAATGVEVVTAVAGRADPYVELPWAAFALGAAVAALLVTLVESLAPGWTLRPAALLHAVVILGAGAACAQAALFAPGFGRLFLSRRRADAAADRYARVLFLERELFRTRDRVGVLILVCLFERRVRVLPDRGFHGRVTADEWHRVVARMTPVLRRRRPAEALQAGLDALAGLLGDKGFRPLPADGNELPDQPVERRGG